MTTKDQSTLAPHSNQREYRSIWDAVADSPEDAASLKVRATLMREIATHVKSKGLTQLKAAKLCNLTQPRMNDLIHGKISKFSLDALVNAATALGLEVNISLRETEPA